MARRGGRIGRELADELQRDKAILGVFDEGCMGMYNAIIPDECCIPPAFSRSVSANRRSMPRCMRTPDSEAAAVREWLDTKA